MFKTVARNRSNIWREPKPGSTASKLRVLTRLIGLETEYGLYRGDHETQTDAGVLFESIRSWFAARTPIAAAIHDQHRFFVANGGCLGIEPSPSGELEAGMLEGATPECRSPFQLVTYQSVQDQLLAECLFDLDAQKSMAWIKNSGDAFGHVYGQHENYELQVARSWRLFLWRFGLVCLLPLLIFYRGLAWLWLGFITIANRLCHIRFKRVLSDKSLNDKPDARNANGPSNLSPRFVRIAATGLRYLHWPVAIVLHWLVVAFVLVPHRRWMAGFFASRAVMDGSGHLDRQGQFWLSARAASITTVIGFGRYWDERPIFGTGHWLRSLLVCQSPTFAAWRSLFSARQRVQVTVGDSTPNPRCQFLRIGATSLVFDLIESRLTQGLPRFNGCIAQMHALTTDQSMMRTISDRQGTSWNAIELQRRYAAAVRQLLTMSHQSIEAWEIVDQWQTTLDHLHESEHDVECQRWLLGRVDWVSKRWLMDQSKSRTSWAAQKKIDLKYHELSCQGYYHMMIQSLEFTPFISTAELNRSMRLPPLDTPAMQRSYWIREFSCENTKLEVDWRTIRWIDDRGRLKCIDISRSKADRFDVSES